MGDEAGGSDAHIGDSTRLERTSGVIRMVTAADASGGGAEEWRAEAASGDAAAAKDVSPANLSQVPPTEFARIQRRLIVLGLVLVAVIFAASGFLAASERSNGLAAIRHSNEIFAAALAEQTKRALQPVDAVLKEIAMRPGIAAGGGAGGAGAAGSAAKGGADGWSAKSLYYKMVESVKGLPQVDAFFVIGADGRTLNAAREYPAPPLDVSQRDHFTYLSAHDDHALHVSLSEKTYPAGKPTVFLSRRINGTNGAFAGIAMAAVTLSFLEDFHRAMPQGDGVVALLRSDGLMLVRYPRIDGQIGNRLLAEAEWDKIMQAGGGSFTVPGTHDAVGTLQKLAEYPLVVSVLQSEDSGLALRHRQLYWLLFATGTATCCVILMIWLFGRLMLKNTQLLSVKQDFDAVLDNISQGLTLFDADKRLKVCNRRYGDIYKLSAEQTLPGTPLVEVLKHRAVAGTFPDMTMENYMARRDDRVKGALSFDLIDELTDGRKVSMHYQPLADGGWVVTHEEITEKCRTDAALAFMVRHDGLTELPNRTLFYERLAEAIATTPRGGQCGLLCLDLDRFNVVNDTLGHPIGDAVLRAIAARLGTIVRDDDTIARLGGDEFAIILPAMKSPDDAAALADRVMLAFQHPFEVDGRRIMIGTSIGVAIAPRDGSVADELMKSADMALSLAKSEGRGTFRAFQSDIDASIQRRRGIEFDLRNAVPAEDFRLHYQPVLDLGTGRVTGFEALVRWEHAERGMVSPAEFIPIAEETGLIVPIGAWVLQTACNQAAEWPDDIEIAVNLSPVQFKRGHLLDMVQSALAASGLSPHRLELEITESALLENSADRLELLHELRALGIRIALDDFGTGYSSLSYLRSFPFDKIKIDQTFISDVNTNKESAAIVGAVVGLARSLGMTTVAEGLETAQQLAMVREQGVAKGQGYLFSRPRPAEQIAGLIRTLRVPEPDGEMPRAAVLIPLLAVAGDETRGSRGQPNRARL